MSEAIGSSDDHFVLPGAEEPSHRGREHRSTGGRPGRAAVLPVLLLALAGCGSSERADPGDTPETSATRSSTSERTSRPSRTTPPHRTPTTAPVVPEDPATAPAPAPQPVDPVPDPEPFGPGADPGTDPGTDPGNFLGSTYEDQAFVDYLTVNDCYRGVAVRLVCPDVGVEFAINDAHQVSAVFFAPGYAGGLPGGVAFGDTPDEVIARLGPPDSSTSTSMTWWSAEGVRLIVSFPVDPAAGFTVNQVSLQLG